MTTDNSNQANKGKNNKSLLIILTILLLGSNGYHIYQKVGDNATIEENTATITNQTQEIADHEASIDNLEADIQTKVDSLSALGLQVDEYENLITDLKEEKKALRSRNFSLRKSKQRLEGIVAGLKEQLILLEEDNIRLSSLTEEQNKTILEKNETLVKKDYEIEKFKKEQAKSEAIIADAAVLSADKFQVASVKNNKAKIKPIYKSKDLETMRVSFKVMPNAVNSSGSKDLFVQVKEPSGSTIYDLSTGGGEFEYNDKKAFYTKQLETLYNKKDGKKVFFVFENSQEYKTGTNTIDVYCEGNLIGSTTFEVK